MSKITRHGNNPVLSNAVEYHNFVFLAGVTADDLSQDVVGQTKQILARIDELLEAHGTDKTRLLQAQIWLKDINDRAALNTLWTAWLPEGLAPHWRALLMGCWRWLAPLLIGGILVRGLV